MKNETENKNWKTEDYLNGDPGERLWESDGRLFLTLPAALRYADTDRATLRQQIARATKEKHKGYEQLKDLKNFNRDKYVFVPYEYCQTLKRENALKDKMKKLEELSMLGVTPDDLQKMIDQVKAEKNQNKG